MPVLKVPSLRSRVTSDEDGMWSIGRIAWRRKTEVLGEKPDTSLLPSPQILHGPVPRRTGTFAVRGHDLSDYTVSHPRTQ